MTTATECCNALLELKQQYDDKVEAIIDRIMAIRRSDKRVIADNETLLSVLNAQLDAACTTSGITDHIAQYLHREYDTSIIPAIEAKINDVTATITKYNWRLRACYSHNPHNFKRVFQPTVFGHYFEGGYRIGKYTASDFDFRLITEYTSSFEDQIHHTIKQRYAMQLLKQWWMSTSNRMKLNSSKRASNYRKDEIVFDDDYRACFSEYYGEYCNYIWERDRIAKKYGGTLTDTMEAEILKNIVDESGVIINEDRQKIEWVVGLALFALVAICVYKS